VVNMAEYIPLTEKYRPKTLDDVVGQDNVVNTLKKLIEKGSIVHMLFVGPPGVGKTSVAHAFAHDAGFPIVEFNASDERGIQFIRTEIKERSRVKGKVIILLDEADNLTEDAQQALRRIMERSAPGVKFILTANYETGIIEPILSRCAVFRFRRLDKKEIMSIVAKILIAEGIKDVDKEMASAIMELIDYVNGDVRRMLNLIDTLIKAGKEITVANVRSLMVPSEVENIFKSALDGDLTGAIKSLEDLYVQNKLNGERTISQLYSFIKNFDTEDIIKAKLYISLGEVEEAIKSRNCNELIQLSRFIATVWASKYVPR